MENLKEQHCIPCEGGVPALKEEEIAALMQELPHWALNESETQISRDVTFKGFYKAMAFLNAVAWIANEEGHHPDMSVGFGYCKVTFTTHAAKGLTQNDFICAAKVDALLKSNS